jgi:phenylpropionate dioxygenase-like ring-hydroxylating dioxygenase large terminal subunit
LEIKKVWIDIQFFSSQTHEPDVSANLYGEVMRQPTQADRALIDDWHVVADLDSISPGAVFRTRLLGVDVEIARNDDADAPRIRSSSGAAVRTTCRYGFVWACLGTPSRDIIAIPEADDDNRHIVTGGSIGVAVSGLRAVENFLDMGHFPFVHTDYLGVEPHTEVPPYEVAFTDDDEVVATNCRFFQPVASPTATGGIMADYVYKVFRPYTVALYKTNPVHPDKRDFIALFVQPVDEENCIAHSFLCYLKDDIDKATVRWFMQLIFAQDKPILENQVPKRLPLDPRAETPIRADASSVYYRRWLRRHDIRYGAIPAG